LSPDSCGSNSLTVFWINLTVSETETNSSTIKESSLESF
jgi:hypothetical protein